MKTPYIAATCSVLGKEYNFGDREAQLDIFFKPPMKSLRRHRYYWGQNLMVEYLHIASTRCGTQLQYHRKKQQAAKMLSRVSSRVSFCCFFTIFIHTSEQFTESECWIQVRLLSSRDEKGLSRYASPWFLEKLNTCSLWADTGEHEQFYLIRAEITLFYIVAYFGVVN